MMFAGSTRRLIGLLVATALLAAACGGSDGESSAPEIDLNQPLATATTEPEPTATTEPTTTEPTATPEPKPTATPEPEPTATPEPEPRFWADVLAVGDCFDRSVLDEGELPTPIDCSLPHEEEIYAVVELDIGPDEAYPGEEELFVLADEALCAEATPEWAGARWDALPFVTYVLYPLEEEWEAGDRSVMCSAGPAQDQQYKIGTAAGGSLDSDDTLLVRVSQVHDTGGEFEDWVLTDELTAIEDVTSITAGEFDIPLRRAGLLDGGFMFYANLVGEPEIPNQLYSFEWDDTEVSEIETPVADFQYASIVNRGRNLVFAAREAADADWNLFALVDGSAVVLGDDDTDEHFPSITPDGERVVFQRDGDLWITDIDGGNQLQLTFTDASEWESSISPDGRWILFASNRSGNDDIWLMPIEGGEATNLTDHPADEFWPSWSNDGSIIYFASDRLAPEIDRGVVMMMNTDGSEQSYFTSFGANQPQPIGAADADAARATFPTLSERYDGADDTPTLPDNAVTIEGEPGTLTSWVHSNERLRAEFPAGWIAVELDQGLASVLVAVDPLEAEDIWESDAVYVTLFESPSVDDFMADHFATALANEICERRDGIDATATGDGRWVAAQENACGDGTGRVAALYNEQTGLGVVIEGQSDDLPSFDEDDGLLTSVLETVEWR